MKTAILYLTGGLVACGLTIFVGCAGAQLIAGNTDSYAVCNANAKSSELYNACVIRTHELWCNPDSGLGVGFDAGPCEPLTDAEFLPVSEGGK